MSERDVERLWQDFSWVREMGGGRARDWRKRSCNGQCQWKLVSLRILLQWWLLVSLFPWGTAALSSWAHFHNKDTHAHPLTLTCTYTQSSDTAFCLLGISLFFWDIHTQSFTAAHMNLVLWGTEQKTHAMSCTVPPQCYTVASIIAQHNDIKVMPSGDQHFVKSDTVLPLSPLLLLLLRIYASLSGCSFLTFSAQ